MMPAPSGGSAVLRTAATGTGEHGIGQVWRTGMAARSEDAAANMRAVSARLPLREVATIVGVVFAATSALIVGMQWAISNNLGPVFLTMQSLESQAVSTRKDVNVLQRGFRSSSRGFFAARSRGFAARSPGFAGRSPGFAGRSRSFAGRSRKFAGRSPRFAGRSPSFAGRSRKFAGRFGGHGGSQDRGGSRGGRGESRPDRGPSRAGRAGRDRPRAGSGEPGPDARHPGARAASARMTGVALRLPPS